MKLKKIVNMENKKIHYGISIQDVMFLTSSSYQYVARKLKEMFLKDNIVRIKNFVISEIDVDESSIKEITEHV